MKQLTVLFFIMSCLLGTKAQFTYFHNRYNNDNWSAALTVLETETGYVISGVSGVISNEYMFRRIVMTAIDHDGNQLWWKTYGEDFHDYYAGLMRGCNRTMDGGFVISGTIWDGIRAVGLLIIFDQNGDSLWSRIYGDTITPGYSSTNFAVCEQLPDKGYIITGDTYISGDDGDILLIRTDSVGNVIWNRHYGALHWVEAGNSVTRLPTGEFLVGTIRQRTDSYYSMDPGILKVDSMGNELWTKYYGGPFSDGHGIVTLASDGNYIAASVYAVAQPHFAQKMQKAWVFKTDTSGNVIWDKQYSDTVFSGWCSTVDELDDGSIILCGTGSFYDGFGTKGWILKTDQNGDSLWMRRYGFYPEYLNHMNDLRVTSDHGIIITGMTMGFPEWEQSIWVQKLDSIGCDTAGCDTTVFIVELKPKTKMISDIHIYPNPANDRIFVGVAGDLPHTGNRRYNMEILNMFGEKVSEVGLTQISESLSHDVSGFAPGLYLLLIRNDQRILGTGKFLVIR
ncbi:MAG: T9SS type A sorting domain-containing protein [Bacteroidales bacterium]|nr:T9SS type A sorting domain-containing protein [Bacteroidales bacterium]